VLTVSTNPGCDHFSFEIESRKITPISLFSNHMMMNFRQGFKMLRSTYLKILRLVNIILFHYLKVLLFATQFIFFNLSDLKMKGQ
jgi:hypothetical protein